MARLGGVELMEEADYSLSTAAAPEFTSLPKRPRNKAAFSKALQDRRRSLSKMKDVLHEEQRNAMREGNDTNLQELMLRWDAVHLQRHLITPFADCFVSHDGQLNHGTKSRFLKFTTRGNRDIVYPLNDIDGEPSGGDSRAKVSRNIFDTAVPPYSTLQIDVMNALHYRGDTGQRGTSLEDIVVGKMKSVLRPWITGRRAVRLQQLHLHIDDPNFVIVHKRAEQNRRDRSRSTKEGDVDDVERANMRSSVGIGFQDDLNVPWSSLLIDRAYKDELASLHLFCAAVAAFELLQGA